MVARRAELPRRSEGLSDPPERKRGNTGQLGSPG